MADQGQHIVCPLGADHQLRILVRQVHGAGGDVLGVVIVAAVVPELLAAVNDAERADELSRVPVMGWEIEHQVVRQIDAGLTSGLNQVAHVAPLPLPVGIVLVFPVDHVGWKRHVDELLGHCIAPPALFAGYRNVSRCCWECLPKKQHHRIIPCMIKKSNYKTLKIRLRLAI
ncbi:MAG: hypothetical protein K0S38_120 [Candidatus Paceibacter sp.]|nr:hypothetical protein [Candidatus Paceibacter sp.]